jgi:pyruvate/2-oxoglutarate dehydrogenase complex dihydrolipoamide dehydrogenase (E3) component
VNRVRVVVIGAGSAGTGAAWRAAKCGADVFLLESAPFLGGTSTIGGVHCWEPGIASNGLNRQLYRHMRKSKNAASVGKTIHPYDSASHIGLNGVLLDEP